MSGTENNNLPSKQDQANEPYFPPPPPGPPPAHSTYAPQHSNENPIPEYAIPPYDPSKKEESDFVGPSPTPTGLYDDADPPPQGHHHSGKSGWSQRFSDWGNKAAAPLNSLVNKMGSETFLPTTMDKECEKAARILKGFCSTFPMSNWWMYTSTNSQTLEDGIYSETAPAQTTTAAGDSSTDGKPKSKSRVILTIPSKVIARAQGLLIFTTVRAGFHVSGASGSGVLVARLPDGSWSPPSGVQVHSVGAGFVVGLDIYDCVIVINTREALQAFTRTRMSLGSDLAVTAGPWGAGGMLDWGIPQEGKGKGKEGEEAASGEQRHGRGDEKPAATAGDPAPGAVPSQPGVTPPPTTTSFPPPPTEPATGTSSNMSVPGTSKDRKPSPLRSALKPVYSYVKSRGFYAGVQIDGTVITERADANAAFYGSRIPVLRILAGDIGSHGASRPSGASLWPAGATGLLDVLKGAEGHRGHSPAPQQQREQQQGEAAAHTRNVSDAGAGSSATAAAAGVSEATAGVGQMNLGAGGSKAAEAAAEAQANAPSSPGPPSYAESSVQDDLPPAYADDGQPRPGVGDNKSGLH